MTPPHTIETLAKSGQELAAAFRATSKAAAAATPVAKTIALLFATPPPASGLGHTLQRFTALGSAPANPRIDTTHGITMLAIADCGVSTLDTAINQAGLLRPQDVEQIITPCANACAAILSGSGRRDHWVTLCSALNMALSIERQGVVRGMAGHLASIEATLLAIAARAGEDDTPPTWQPPQLSLDETDNMRLLVQLHKFQLEQLSYGEYRRAFAATVNRVRGGGGEAVNLPAEFGPEVTV